MSQSFEDFGLKIDVLGYNNDFKPPFNNGRGGFNKRNDFRSDRNGDQQSGGGFYRAKPDYQQNDDFGNRGGYRSVSYGVGKGEGMGIIL